MRKELKTVRELRAAVRKAKEIVIRPRFGVGEAWIKIAKKEAMTFVTNLPDVTPEEFEMYGTTFGTLEDGTLYLG